MRRLASSIVLIAAGMAAGAFNCRSLQAADIIVNGGLEDGAGPANWILTQSTAATPPLGDFNSNNNVDAADYVLWRKYLNTSHTLSNDNGLGTPIGPNHYTLWRSRFGNMAAGLPVAAVELLTDAQEPPSTTGLGLLIHPAAGNNLPYENQNLPVNFSLTQTFVAGPSAPGKTYTFSGDSTYQGAYSGNLDTLYADSPSGAIPSPTQTQFQMTFLSSTNAVLGTSVLNLPKHRVDTNPATWEKDSLSAIAPANTFKVQVTVSATNMVASCTTACPFGQDVRFDNFSLKDTTVTEHLMNGSLDQVGVPSGWSLQTVGNDVVQFSNGDFARHGGNVGMWLRAFQGNSPNPPANNPGPVDAIISQIVAGTPGAPYTFSAWAKLQQGYSGLDSSSGTQTFLKMEFLDGTGTPIPNSTVSLDMGPNGPLGPNFWPPGPDNGQGVYPGFDTDDDRSGGHGEHTGVWGCDRHD